MENQKVLTVVVPSYNVEKYLDECLSSFVVPYEDSRLEVLVVNDGSTDSTEAIALTYAYRYPDTVKVFTKVNGGHGSTINYGLTKATGKYFKVIDGDDYIDNSILKEFLDFMESSDEDVITNDKIDFYEGTDIRKHLTFGQVEYGKTLYTKNIELDWTYSIHRISVKTEILRQHMPAIDEKCFYVDQEFTLYSLPYVQTLKASDVVLYYYRLGNVNQSVSQVNVYKRRDNLLRVIYSLLSFYSMLDKKELSENIIKYIDIHIAEQINHYLNIVLRNPKTNKENLNYAQELQKKVKKEYPSIYAVLPKNKYKTIFQILPKAWYIYFIRTIRKNQI